MSVNRVNAVLIGKGKDEFGFTCDVLEDPLTKKRFAAYSVEVWMERALFLAELVKLNERTSYGSEPTPAC